MKLDIWKDWIAQNITIEGFRGKTTLVQKVNLEKIDLASFPNMGFYENQNFVACLYDFKVILLET